LLALEKNGQNLLFLLNEGAGEERIAFDERGYEEVRVLM
jgi:hypothetical protein